MYNHVKFGSSATTGCMHKGFCRFPNVLLLIQKLLEQWIVLLVCFTMIDLLHVWTAKL